MGYETTYNGRLTYYGQQNKITKEKVINYKKHYSLAKYTPKLMLKIIVIIEQIFFSDFPGLRQRGSTMKCIIFIT